MTARKSFPFLLTFNVWLAAAGLGHAGLVAHWKFDEGTGVTTMSEVGGWIGTLSGDALPEWELADLPPVPEGTLAALRFDPTLGATAPYVATDFPGVLGSNARTIACWIKADPVQPELKTIVGWGSNVQAGRSELRLNESPGSGVVGAIRYEVSGSFIVGTKDLRDGQWHHVAMTLPQNGRIHDVKFFIDGNPEPISGKGSNNLQINTQAGPNVTIGNAGWALGGRGFNGLIDDVRIYDEALTEEQIKEIVFGAGVPPSIPQPIPDAFIVLGDPDASASFTVSPAGSAPLFFQWRFEGTDLPGETNATLVIDPAGPDNVGDYTVVISNAYGVITSEVARLEFTTAPIVPGQQAVLEGATATFAVTMPDVPGYTYQWQRDGTDIPDATHAQLTLANVQAADAGAYTVRVTLGAHSAISRPAQLVVLPVPASGYAAEVLADSPSGYWRLGETSGTTAADQTTFHDGAYVGDPILGQAGALVSDTDPAVLFNGANYVEVPSSTELNTPDAFTIEAWAWADAIGGLQAVLSSRGQFPSLGYNLYATDGGRWQFWTADGTSGPQANIWDQLDGAAVEIGTWVHLVGTFDGTTKRFYINGHLVNSSEVAFAPAIGVPLRIGAGATESVNASQFFNGAIDEVAIYRYALPPERVLAHYLAGTIPPGIPPTIVKQPGQKHLVLGATGQTFTFAVVAQGSVPLHYQWHKDGVPIPGANEATFVITDATPDDVGIYTVEVSNDAGSVVSDGAALSLSTAPIEPGNVTLLVGESTTLRVTMPDVPGYQYQWQKDGVHLPGATQDHLDLSNVQEADAGLYSVVVSLGPLAATSMPVRLIVEPLPAQPYWDTLLFSFDAPVGYWRLGEAPGATQAADELGFHTGTYFSAVTLGVEGVTLGDFDTAAAFNGSSDAKVEVPYDTVLNWNTFSVEFWATVTGGSGTFRSPVTSREIAGSQIKGWTFYVTSEDRWQFRIGDGTETWNILDGPPAVPHQWTHVVGTYDGTTMRLYINGALVDSRSASYMPVDNSAIPLRIGGGATEDPTGSMFWQGRIDEVAVYDIALSAETVAQHFAAAFQAGTGPVILAQPRGRVYLAGEPVTLSVAAHATPPVSYQWQFNGQDLPGATDRLLHLQAVSPADAGAYRVVISNAGGSVTSDETTLDVVEGIAININFLGTSDTRTVAAFGGQAGVVTSGHWNEIGLRQSVATATNLVDSQGQPTSLGIEWQAVSANTWGGAFGEPAADFALLSGHLRGTSSGDVIIRVSGVPPAFQQAGYDVYVHTTEGGVQPTTWFGMVTDGTTTFYHHALDMDTWDGVYVRNTNTNPDTPPDANYCVFEGLTAESFTITAAKHPTMFGPVGVAALQIVAPVVSAPKLSIRRSPDGSVTIEWDGAGTLQQADRVEGPWQNVQGAVSPYTIAAPTGTQFFRVVVP